VVQSLLTRLAISYSVDPLDGNDTGGQRRSLPGTIGSSLVTTEQLGHDILV